jgi:hypothetical protein
MNAFEAKHFQNEPRPQDQSEDAVREAFDLARSMWRQAVAKQAIYRTVNLCAETLRQWLLDKHVHVHDALRCATAPAYVAEDIPTVSDTGRVYGVIPEGAPIDPNDPLFLFTNHPLFIIWARRIDNFFLCYKSFEKAIRNRYVNSANAATLSNKNPAELRELLRQFVESEDELTDYHLDPADHVIVAAVEYALTDAALPDDQSVWAVFKHAIGDWQMGPAKLAGWLSGCLDTAALISRNDFTPSMLAATDEDWAIAIDWTGQSNDKLGQQLHDGNCWTIQARQFNNGAASLLAVEDGQVLLECEMLRAVLFDRIRCELPVLYVNENEATLVRYPLVPSLLEDFFLPRLTPMKFIASLSAPRFETQTHHRLVEQLVDGKQLMDGGSGDYDADLQLAKVWDNVRDATSLYLRQAPDRKQRLSEEGTEHDLKILDTLKSSEGLVIGISCSEEYRELLDLL